MKKLFVSLAFSLMIPFAFSQNCIDYILYHVDSETGSRLDTLVCRIMAEDDYAYTIDNGFAISTLSKKMVDKVIPCAREMSLYEIYKYKGIDNVTLDYFQQAQTSGNYLRKAAFNMYLATGLAVTGAGGIVLGTTVFKNNRSQNFWIIGGGVVCAASLFFYIVSWNNIYKAGKLMDINSRAALYLSPTQEGNLGLSIKF